MVFPPLRRVASQEDPHAEEILDLFESLFPPEELEPREVIAGEWHGSPYETWTFEEGGKTGGICRGRVDPDREWCWIVHIGLRPDLRGRGWGADLLLEGIEQICRESPKTKGTILEVERVQDALDPESRLAREKRLAFFDRLGAELLSPTYIQASVRPGCPPVPLNLLWLQRSPGIPDAPALIQSFYRTAFGLAMDHPFVRCALGRLGLEEALSLSEAPGPNRADR